MKAPAAVSRLFGFEPVGAPALIATGTLNWNYRVDTTGGPLFVRKHRFDRTREHIEAEHGFVADATARGIPAPTPIRDRAGATVVEHDGGLWAAYPWLNAAPPTRGAMSERQVRAAGEMHGRIHATFADHPGSGGPVPPLGYDTAASLVALERLLELARRREHPLLIHGLELQLALLTEHGPPADSYAGLRQGVSHGDYHDQQLLFRGDRLAAVTDWELWGVRPLVSELLRSLYFSQIMETTLMPVYLAGYREHIRLTEADCLRGMDRWWQGRLHTFWVFSAYLVEGNERVAEFFPETLRALRALADAEARRELTERFVRAATR